MKLVFLMFILGCQSSFSTPIDAAPTPDAEIVWEAGCTNYECTISKEFTPSGPIFIKIKWCCPFLDKAIGSVLMSDNSGEAWISTNVEYQCGTTAVFYISPLITAIEASMQTKSRPEMADKCMGDK